MIGEEYGRTFLVMELLDGNNLREVIAAKGALSLDQLLKVAVDVADALESAHEKGVLHRDIKPANIFITRRGQAKILDFGVAKIGGTKRIATANTPNGQDSALDTGITVAGHWERSHICPRNRL